MKAKAAKEGGGLRVAGRRRRRAARQQRPEASETPAAAGPDAAGEAVRRAALAALEKQRAGKVLSAREAAAVEKFKVLREEEQRDRALRSVPQQVLCELLGVSKQSVHAWCVEGLPHVGYAGKFKLFDLHTVLPWLRKRWTAQTEGGGSDLRRAQTENTREQTALRRMKREMMEGELVRRSDVVAENVQKIKAIRAGFHGLATVIGQDLPTCRDEDEVQAMLTRHFDDLCRRFAAEAHHGEEPLASSP